MWQQAPQDNAEFMVASGEWPPPSGTSQRDRFVAAMLADLQVRAHDYTSLAFRVELLQHCKDVQMGAIKRCRDKTSAEIWSLRGAGKTPTAAGFAHFNMKIRTATSRCGFLYISGVQTAARIMTCIMTTCRSWPVTFSAAITAGPADADDTAQYHTAPLLQHNHKRLTVLECHRRRISRWACVCGQRTHQRACCWERSC